MSHFQEEQARSSEDGTSGKNEADTTSCEGAEQSLPARYLESIARISAFLHRLFDGVEYDGPLYVNVASNANWKGEFYHWPEQAEAAATRALQLDAEGRDVYFCAALMTTRDRRKELAAPVQTLWCDLDRDRDKRADIGRGPQASVVVESSPGNAHVYYRLSSQIEPARAEGLNSRIAHAIGGDKSGFDLAQLLRVPQTHNYKPARIRGGMSPAVVIVQESSALHDPNDLEKTLPPVPKRNTPNIEFDPNEPPVRGLSPGTLDLWFGRHTVKKPDGATNRSETLWAIAKELGKAGMTTAGLCRALQDRDSALGFNKYTGRPNLYADIATKVLSELVRSQVHEPVFRSSLYVNGNPSPPPRYLVQDLILEGQIGLIGGPTYAGKSLFAMDVAVSLVTGKNVVDHPGLTIPKIVSAAYVYAEQGEAQWERRMFATERHKGVKAPADIPLFLVSGYELDLRDAEKLTEFIAVLKDKGIEVVIFDPLAVLFPSDDENDVSEVMKAARIPLQEITRAGITPIAVHHSSKRYIDREAFDALELIRGSGDISAMSGSIIGVQDRKKAGTKVIPRVRGQSVRPFRLLKKEEQASPLGSAFPQSLEELTSEPVRILTFDGPWEKPEGSSEEAILDFLRDHKKATSKEIADALGIASRTTQEHIKNLHKSGRVNGNRHGRVFRYTTIEQRDEAA